MDRVAHQQHHSALENRKHSNYEFINPPFSIPNYIPPRQNPSGCSFFDLPAEIRNKIYSLYVSDLCVVVRDQTKTDLYQQMTIPQWCPDRRPGWLYFDPDKKARGPAHLLAVCRTILHEFLYILHHEAAFFFRLRCDFITAYHRNSLNFLNAFHQTLGPRNLVHPFLRIKTLDICLHTTEDLDNRVSAGESRRVTNMIMDIILFNMPSLKRLQLQINFRTKLFINDRMLQPWFLRRLCQLRNLNYFGLDFMGINHRTKSTILRDAAACIFGIHNIINCLYCEKASDNTNAIIPQLDQFLYNDNDLQKRISREVVTFLNSNGEDNARLVSLLEADIQALE